MRTSSEYVAHNHTCPYCDSEDVDWGQIETDDSGASRDSMCNQCGLLWVENFVLTGYTVISCDFSDEEREKIIMASEE